VSGVWCSSTNATHEVASRGVNDGVRDEEHRPGVLVTGASRGLGAEVARVFAAHCGARVAVHYRGARDAAERLVDELDGDGHVAVRGDLADHEQVRRFVGEAVDGLGRIDVLVNNAALYADDPVAQGRRLNLDVATATYEEWTDGWRRTTEVNLLGTANVTYLVARHMIDTEPAAGRPRGRIVTVGSRGAYRGEPTVPAYGASKAGVHAMTQSLAVALAPHGIGCVGIAPGFIATDMTAALLDGPDGAAIRAQSPFGRVATVREVALAIMQLAQPESEWASGGDPRLQRRVTPALSATSPRIAGVAGREPATGLRIARVRAGLSPFRGRAPGGGGRRGRVVGVLGERCGLDAGAGFAEFDDAVAALRASLDDRPRRERAEAERERVARPANQIASLTDLLADAVDDDRFQYEQLLKKAESRFGGARRAAGRRTAVGRGLGDVVISPWDEGEPPLAVSLV